MAALGAEPARLAGWKGAGRRPAVGAAHGGTLMIAGAVTRIVVRHHGKRRVRFVNETAAVWRSRDNGAHWWRANPRSTGGQQAGSPGSQPPAPGSSHPAQPCLRHAAPRWPTSGPRVHLAVRRQAEGPSACLAVCELPSWQRPGRGGDRHDPSSPRGAGQHAWTVLAPARDLGRSSANAITGATVGPGGKVVAAGRSRRGSFLLARGHRLPVGQAALAATAAAGVSASTARVGPARGRRPPMRARPASRPPGRSARPAGQSRRHADGKPRSDPPPGGRWARAIGGRATVLAGHGPRTDHRGPRGAGWLAVGDEGGGAAQAEGGAADAGVRYRRQGGRQPVLATSPDGWTWRPAAGAGP
jgi:hypothetical protein